MRGKSNQNLDEDVYEDDEFGPRKEGPSSNFTTNNNIGNSSTINKDGKNIDKANAIRSKHSVTEQRRRSKINERFQVLRDLIPQSDQKRDTASFLLEVIEYVQYLQEKVQKYEGAYQGWSPEPTKLMPWKNSHWRGQSFVAHAQSSKNGTGPGSAFFGKLDDNDMTISPTMLTSMQNLVESASSKDAACKIMEQQLDLTNKGFPLSMPSQTGTSTPVRSDVGAHPLQQSVSDAQIAEFPAVSDTLNQHEELTIEGGTISISSAYSQGLLNTLIQALQDAGIDLSHANVSVQIDLGKRANRALSSSTSTDKDPCDPPSGNQAMTHVRSMNSEEDSDQAQKRLKA